MPDGPLIAHSLAEAYLYLMATPCPSCGRGPLQGSDARAPDEKHTQRIRLAIDVRCNACGQSSPLTFDLPLGLGTTKDRESGPAVVNPTEEPSQIIDVAQWLTLFRMITEAASREANKVEARMLGLEAAQCLEEALRFYEDQDNDLPPREAFFHDSSRKRLADHPEQFSRRRLVELRAKLPTISVMRDALSDRKKRSWWRRH